MALKQIPNLPPVLGLVGNEQIELVQAGVSSRAAVSQIEDWLRTRPTDPRKVVIHVGPTAPVPAVAGQLWFYSEDVPGGGALYVYYNDGNSAQWVPASPAGSGSGGSTSVTTSDTAPNAPVDGDLWWDSTAGSLFVFYVDANSAQWVPASPTGSGTSTNVRSFGATGGGVTDDVTYINAAIDATSAQGGGVVLFPPGTYLVGPSGTVLSAAVVMKSNVHLVGSGVGATIIKLANGADCQVINGADIVNCSVSAMTIDGNRTAQTVAVHGIRIANSSNVRLANLYIKSARHYGIGFQDGTLTNITIDGITLEDIGGDGIDFKNRNDDNSGIEIANIVIKSFNMLGSSIQTGIDIRGPANLVNITVESVPVDSSGIRFRHGELLDANGFGGHQSNLTNFRIVSANALDAIGVWSVARNVKMTNGYVLGCQLGLRADDTNTSIANAHVEGCVVGIYVNAVDGGMTGNGGSIVGCLVKGNTSHGIQLKPGASNWRITGSRIEGNGGSGIFIQAGPPSTDATIITDNHFSGNVTNPIGNAGTNTKIWNNAGYVTESRGSIAGTTNASGDIAVAHGLFLAPTQVVATVTGTTFGTVQKTTQSSTTITFRFFGAGGTPLASTAVTADWRAWRS